MMYGALVLAVTLVSTDPIVPPPILQMPAISERANLMADRLVSCGQKVPLGYARVWDLDGNLENGPEVGTVGLYDVPTNVFQPPLLLLEWEAGLRGIPQRVWVDTGGTIQKLEGAPMEEFFRAHPDLCQFLKDERDRRKAK